MLCPSYKGGWGLNDFRSGSYLLLEASVWACRLSQLHGFGHIPFPLRASTFLSEKWLYIKGFSNFRTSGGTSLAVQWLRVHTLQLESPCAAVQIEGPRPATKTWHDQIGKYLSKKKKNRWTPKKAVCKVRQSTLGGTPHPELLLLLLSHFSRVRLCATPQTAAQQAPPSLGFSRQEHWSGLPFPSPTHESKK